MKLIYIILISFFLIGSQNAMATVLEGTYDTTVDSSINGVRLISIDPTLTFCNVEYQGISYDILQGSTQIMPDGTTVKVDSIVADNCELEINTVKSDIISIGSTVNGIGLISTDTVINKCNVEYQGIFYNINKGDTHTMPDGTTVKVASVAADNCELIISTITGGNIYNVGVGSTVNGVMLIYTNPSINKCYIIYKENYYDIIQGSTQTMPDGGTTVKVTGVAADNCELEINTVKNDIISSGSTVNGVRIVSSNVLTKICNIEYQGISYSITQGYTKTMPDGLIIGVNDITADNCELNFDFVSAGGGKICLYKQGDTCLLEETRAEGDTRGLVGLNERSGIANVLGNQATWRNFLDFLDINSGQYDFEPECLGARVCSNDEESSKLRCSSVSNDVCPEDYGDWDRCQDNYLGGKCTPCDPDCQDCGHALSIDVEDVSYDDDGIDIPVSVRCEAYGYENRGDWNEGRFVLYKGNILVGLGGQILWEYNLIDNSYADCTLEDNDDNDEDNDYYICAANFNTIVGEDDNPVEPCELYNFKCDFEYKEIEDGEYEYINTIMDSGMVKPYITITRPEPGDEIGQRNNLQESTTLSADVECGAGGSISLFTWNLYQEEHVCKIYEEPEYNEYSWNTRRCPDPENDISNGNYILDATAIGTNGRRSSIYTDSIDITINNPPEEQEFKVLNVILARIKTWL